MKFTNTEVFGFEGAIRGMRNPKNSWSKSDSCACREDGSFCLDCDHKGQYCIGTDDLKLAQRLILAGSEHRKFMRQIMVSVDITAPMYWWGEFDTYKVGTTANSTSKMHKLASTPITLDCFETDDLKSELSFEQCIAYEYPQELNVSNFIENLIDDLESLRLKFLETKDIRYWKELIRWLPESWLQTRTVTMSYENVRNMYLQRVKCPHKLTEWKISFGDWVKTLPYSNELICIDKKSKNI